MADTLPQQLTVGILRELIRNLQLWESYFESDGIYEINGPDGTTYNLSDIQYLYECRSYLSPRQRQAIEMCLYNDIREKDATLLMGVSQTNPVAMYATNGLARLLELAREGKLPRYSIKQRPAHITTVVVFEEVNN